MLRVYLLQKQSVLSPAKHNTKVHSCRFAHAQALHIGGAYPFSSLQNMLYMLFITIRDTDTAIWESKLSLLLYYLLDLDYLQPGQQRG